MIPVDGGSEAFRHSRTSLFALVVEMLLSTTKAIHILLLFVTLSLALVTSDRSIEARNSSTSLATVVDQTDDSDIVISHLPDGRLRYDFYHAGALELYVEEDGTDEGSFPHWRSRFTRS